MNAEIFNALYEVGVPVFAYPGFRPEDVRDATRLVTRTRTKAQSVGLDREGVVWVEDHGAYIALSHVDVVTEDEWTAARAAEDSAAARVRHLRGQMRPAPPADDVLAAYESVDFTDLMDEEAAVVVARMRDRMLGEIGRLRAELAKYVGAEPTIAEEMAYLSSCLDAVRDLCDATEKQARRWENPLPVPEWVEQVREAASGERPADPNDHRRRIYIDGKGEAWLSLSHDRDIRYVGRLAGAFHGDDTTESVRERTGSLREIGRCW